MFAHHHVQRERLSVRVRMSDILASLEQASFVEFVNLFKPEEGRMGVTVTFVAILELVREGLIDIVQTEAYAPLHVRSAQGHADSSSPWTTTPFERGRRRDDRCGRAAGHRSETIDGRRAE